jgi:hypothetical protein
VERLKPLELVALLVTNKLDIQAQEYGHKFKGLNIIKIKQKQLTSALNIQHEPVADEIAS